MADTDKKCWTCSFYSDGMCNVCLSDPNLALGFEVVGPDWEACGLYKKGKKDIHTGEWIGYP